MYICLTPNPVMADGLVLEGGDVFQYAAVFFDDAPGGEVVRATGQQQVVQAEGVAFLQGKGEHFGRVALVPAGGMDGVADVAAVLAQEVVEFVADIDDAAHLCRGVVPGEIGGVGNFGDAVRHECAAGRVAEG